LKIITVLASAATAGAVGIVNAPLASAEDATASSVGTQAKLLGGNVIQGWTISNLKTSSDQIPYPVNGTPWEATATDEAIQGGAPQVGRSHQQLERVNGRGFAGILPSAQVQRLKGE
jgi:Domain of unknown function (DUF1942)